MTANKKAPALTEAQSTKRAHFTHILDAITVIYCIAIAAYFLIGRLA